jgi:hypothetical protein
MLNDVEIQTLDPRRFEGVIGEDRSRRFLATTRRVADRLDGRRLLQVNSTEQGGGVAEMLHFLGATSSERASTPTGACSRATMRSSR